jgi:lambda repressor-like predicted transcriptional regulator
MATAEIDFKNQILESAPFLMAFIECDPEIQQIVAEMAAIITDKNSTDDERIVAAEAIREALNPSLAADVLTQYNEIRKSPESRQSRHEICAEQATFAERLRAAMTERGLTQEQLAAAAGVGQPAVSNLLKRHCRPQRKTVVRFAEVLGISPSDLWPDWKD